MTPWYGVDLAYIQARAFDDYAAERAPELVRMLRDEGVRDGRVVDLGCGAGALTNVFSDAGFDVVGIDTSRPLLDIAKRRAPRATFQHGTIFGEPIPDAVAVFAIGEVLSYGPPNAEELDALFTRVHRALGRNGRFVFDVPVHGNEWNRERHFCGKDWAILMTATAAPHADVLTRDITIFRKIGTRYRRSHERHRLRLFRRHTLLGRLERAGFDAAAVTGYGDVAMLPSRVGFIARKP